MSREVKVALGGGGSRGLAHIGVLAALEQSDYRIAALAGTSIGGVMAAAYAAGRSPADMAEWAAQALRKGIFRFRPSSGGLLGIDRIREVLHDVLGDRTFADTRCPLALTAVHLETGSEVILQDGRLLDAVLATIALPGIFPPLGSGAARLIDGGVLDPVPVAAVRRLGRGPVVAVVLSQAPGSAIPESMGPLGALPGVSILSRFRVGEALNVFSRSLEIMSRMFADLRLSLDRPEVIVRPDVGWIGILETPEVDPAIEAGRRAMNLQLGELAGWYGIEGALRRIRRRLAAREPG
jgi:NTE family protein